MRPLPLAMLLGATLSVACDDRADAKATNAAATDGGTTVTRDLKQAARDVGSSAVQAGRAASDEAKKEVRNLDVRVTTKDAAP